jgi:hypothetical protein
MQIKVINIALKKKQVMEKPLCKCPWVQQTVKKIPIIVKPDYRNQGSLCKRWI